MLKRLLPYALKYKKYFILAIVCILTETVFEMIIPFLMADMIDVGIATGNQAYMIRQGVIMMLCAIIAFILGRLYARFTAIAGQGFGAELRRDEFKRVQNFSFKNMDHFQTSSLITRLTSDATIIQNAICNGMRPFIRAPFMFLMCLIFSLMINVRLSLIFIIVSPILAIGLFLIVSHVGPLYRLMQSSIDEVNTVVQENLNAIRVVKSYVKEGYEEEKFEKINEELRQHSTDAFSTQVLNTPLFQYCMYTTIVCILYFGGQMIFNGEMQVGELTGFLSYVLQILNSFMLLSNVFLMVTRSIASCERICEVLDETSDIVDTKSTLVMHKGNITFDHVYFKYKDSAKQYVLSDITLDIPSGSTIGILGGTGSAKSSLVQLIPRLYDVTKGSITIDGHNVKDYPLTYLRDNISMVLQKNTLFSGTIKDNLLWGNKDASNEDIKWACHVSCVDEFIDNFSHKYDTDLGQGGVNVSGGQKQRLCIARALLKHPKVLILDDSTSAVDTATEASIREGLDSLKETTKIIIAQRVSSVLYADKIVILDDGHIDEIGTHDELLEHNKIYQDIYYTQLKGAGL
ncbi:MAG: ABC transporter ATP-binding protein/permease [Erysipelotrichaceae bacterium]|nr:ABC transporter ATP-binding protein/permease [Erysipelotrichaceae bacterium]